MSTIKIGRITDTGDNNIRIYQVRVTLTEEPIELAYAKMHPENGVLDALVQITGVQMVELHPYYAVVFKAAMFEWSEIEPHVKALLSALQRPLEGSAVTLEDDIRPDESE